MKKYRLLLFCSAALHAIRFDQYSRYAQAVNPTSRKEISIDLLDQHERRVSGQVLIYILEYEHEKGFVFPSF